MRCRTSLFRPLALLPLIACSIRLLGQNPSYGSPYSSYGLGDLVPTNQVPSALMGGTGIAVTDPYSIFSLNPASYSGSRQPDLGGLQRPCFEGAVRGVFINSRTQEASTNRSDAQFMGFNIGVPFRRGRSGMAFGLAPASDVGYSLTDAQEFEGGTVKYEYTGSGGLNRVFAGLGHIFLQQKGDSLGDLGARLVMGGNFDYYFGGIEQSRKAIYPAGQSYTNTAAYSSLVLSAPSGSFGLHFSDDLPSRKVRHARARERMERWKVAHVDTLLLSREQRAVWQASPADTSRRAFLRDLAWRVAYLDSTTMPTMPTFQGAHPWRYMLGATLGLATDLKATNTVLNTAFSRGFTGVEILLDTLPSSGVTSGSLSIPVAYGLGLSVFNQRFLFTVEARRRDWSAMKVNVDGYSLPAPLRANMVYALGARFTPAQEGPFFERLTYRAGLRYSEDYQQVQGHQLRTASASLGVSVPLNAAQTNSFLHIGGEFGQRGTPGSTLVQENVFNLWVGVSLAPWRGERWFRPYQVQ